MAASFQRFPATRKFTPPSTPRRSLANLQTPRGCASPAGVASLILAEKSMLSGKALTGAENHDTICG